jgi:hypothetical protein
MAKTMKYHPTNSVLFCTSSVEEGILLLANPLWRLIINSCLAAAQTLYPVDICHAEVEGTHLHLIVRVKNPEDVPRFLGYFKSESAHRINNILGRNKRTVWCAGYDSPIVLTPVRALVAIAYLYANPAKDGLEVSIDKYPGWSTWKMFNSGELTKTWTHVRRNHFRALTKDSHNLRGYTKEAERISATATETVEFTLSPNAWLEAFGITDSQEQARWNKRIVERVRLLEARYRRIREQKHLRVIGAERLLKQPVDLTYRPKRTGRRMWCLSEKRSVRQRFISLFRELMFQAREVLKRWKNGDFSVPYPPGLHAPSMPRLANMLP